MIDRSILEKSLSLRPASSFVILYRYWDGNVPIFVSADNSEDELKHYLQN